MNIRHDIASSSSTIRIVDFGLRAYMLTIYNYMALALAVTGAVAFFSAQSALFLNAMYVIQDGTIISVRAFAWIVTFAPLGLVVYLSFGLSHISLLAAQIIYWVYALLVGLSLSVIFLMFTGGSIAQVFFITASIFGVMSVVGYSTKRDLTSFASFLMMALVGLIIASVVQLFLRSSGMQFVLSILGVLIFISLTAYDTQKLKAMYYQSTGEGKWSGKLAIMGALTLYLDFINIFLNLLNLFGERKR